MWFVQKMTGRQGQVIFEDMSPTLEIARAYGADLILLNAFDALNQLFQV